jgi:HD-GYP domain-containing protein (c-di-GMP phosphodiesterase class II)
MNLSRKEIENLTLSGILHDIGECNIDTKTISKKQILEEDDIGEMKKHPIYGADILRKKYFFDVNTILGVEQHHEKVDGTGYPFGITGDRINKYAKIISVCDTYDSISNDSVYKKKFKPNDAYEFILSQSGIAFDKEVVTQFKRVFSMYPMGSCVKLSNGIEGYIIKQNENFPDRPVIRVLYDSNTKEPIPFYEIDLLNEIDKTIICVI